MLMAPTSFRMLTNMGEMRWKNISFGFNLISLLFHNSCTKHGRSSSQSFLVLSLFINDTQERARWEGSSSSLCLADYSSGISHLHPQFIHARGCSCRWMSLGPWTLWLGESDFKSLNQLAGAQRRVNPIIHISLKPSSSIEAPKKYHQYRQARSAKVVGSLDYSWDCFH